MIVWAVWGDSIRPKLIGLYSTSELAQASIGNNHYWITKIELDK